MTQESKEVFEFAVDIKETVWYRQVITIPAYTKDEAEKIAIQLVADRENGDIDSISEVTDYDRGEYLFDTAENMTVEENLGKPTVELMDFDGKHIYDNACNK